MPDQRVSLTLSGDRGERQAKGVKFHHAIFPLNGNPGVHTRRRFDISGAVGQRAICEEVMDDTGGSNNRAIATLFDAFDMIKSRRGYANKIAASVRTSPANTPTTNRSMFLTG